MLEGKRQKQVAGVIHEEMTGIFRKLGLSMIDGGLLSISSVKVTPDLLEARIYLSVFQAKDNAAVLKKWKTKPMRSNVSWLPISSTSYAVFRRSNTFSTIHWTMYLKWRNCLKKSKKRKKMICSQ